MASASDSLVALDWALYLARVELNRTLWWHKQRRDNLKRHIVALEDLRNAAQAVLEIESEEYTHG